jgi:ABC-type glutathione transport system ATPase component
MPSRRGILSLRQDPTGGSAPPHGRRVALVAMQTESAVLATTPRPGHESPQAITVAGLRKSYGPVRAVRDVSFCVRHGEIVALLGPNGAGKTTTLEILERFRARDGGAVAGAVGAVVAVRRFRWDPRPE